MGPLPLGRDVFVWVTSIHRCIRVDYFETPKEGAGKTPGWHMDTLSAGKKELNITLGKQDVQ